MYKALSFFSSTAFVVWATEVMDMFSSIFTRHVFTSQDQQSAAECLEIANQHCLVVSISFYYHLSIRVYINGSF